MIPTFGQIYPLKHEQSIALKKYIDNNLKKGFIRESKLLVGYLIFFIKKKDSTTLRPVIDYRQLNKITVKPVTLYYLIGEIIDRIHRVF